MAGPELMLISAGLSLVQGFQGFQQGKAQAKAAQRTAEYNVANEQQRAEVEKTQLKRQQQIFAGQQKTRAGVTGATLESFSDTFEDTTTQSLLDLALLDYDTKVRQNQIRYGGQVEASSARAQGQNALISGIAGAAQSGMSYVKTPQYDTITWNPTKSDPRPGQTLYRRR